MRDRVFALLEKSNRAMTIEKIAEEAEISVRSAKSAVTYAKSGKLVYIKDWHRPPPGQHGKPAAMYAIGNEPDAELIPLTQAEYNRRYRQRHHARLLLKEAVRRNGSINPFHQLAHATKHSRSREAMRSIEAQDTGARQAGADPWRNSFQWRLDAA
ncbi:hypothetical protein [Paraburkholderia phenoliruptrix]|uniref:hypothetical protein n=1 Tax=Paraburkholderia phenoliruptrix TaxID=252970 RepID=UPI0034CD0A60